MEKAPARAAGPGRAQTQAQKAAARSYLPRGGAFQMRSAYSRTERSLENLPMLAVLRMDVRVQASGSSKSRSTRRWVST